MQEIIPAIGGALVVGIMAGMAIGYRIGLSELYKDRQKAHAASAGRYYACGKTGEVRFSYSGSPFETSPSPIKEEKK